MSFTYNDSLASTRDEVRCNLGDTRSTDPLLTDGVIDALLTRYNDNVNLTTAECCLKIVGKIARDTTVSGAAGTQNRKEKVDRYMELYKLYKALAGENAEAFVGGSSTSDNEDLTSDSDFVQPSFNVGQDDYIVPDATDGST